MAVSAKLRQPPPVTVAIPTPFAEDGAVDTAGIRRIMAWLIEQGIESVIPAGTTGEFAGMTASERVAVLVATREAMSRGFVFANVSSCAVDDALEHAKQAMACGARPDALLLLPPFYHAPFAASSGAAGVERFFRAFLDRLPAAAPPLYLYTFAMHTQQPIPPEVYGHLCRDYPGRIGGIKASAVGLEEAQTYAAAGPGTSVLVGNGRITHGVLSAGLRVVSGDCVAVSWALLRLQRLLERGDADGAEAARRALVGVWRETAMDLHDEVPAVKAAFASIAGVEILPVVRPPLVPLDAAAAGAVVGAIARLREAFGAIP